MEKAGSSTKDSQTIVIASPKHCAHIAPYLNHFRTDLKMHVALTRSSEKVCCCSARPTRTGRHTQCETPAQRSPPYLQKSPMYLQKSRIYLQNSPIYTQKSPMSRSCGVSLSYLSCRHLAMLPILCGVQSVVSRPHVSERDCATACLCVFVCLCLRVCPCVRGHMRHTNLPSHRRMHESNSLSLSPPFPNLSVSQSQSDSDT